MHKTIYISILLFSLYSYSIQNSGVLSTYKKSNGAANSFIYLNKNGTFLTRLSGGCDGRLETKGKWKINKDTLHFTNIESRVLDDPWEKSRMDQKYLIQKQTLIAFWIVENKIMPDSTERYKKVKNSK